jgi:hypothetical protein
MSDRRDYVLGVAAQLWPEAELTVRSRPVPGPESGSSFVLVPDADSPRLMIPVGAADAAASIRAYGGHGSRRAWARTQVLSRLFALGLGQRLVRARLDVGRTPADGLAAHLSDALGTPVVPALHIGPPRANRKPVLALVADGEIVGFAKLGTGPLTRRLVEAESRALSRLADLDLPGVRTPRVLYAGEWGGLAILVQEALPVRRARPTPEGRRLAAMLAVARSHGVTTTPAAGSPFVRDLRRDVATLSAGDAARTLAAVLDRVVTEDGPEEPIEHGAWHGDWTPWNTAATAAEVLVWDWERFATGVPLGFDALHHHLQSALSSAAAPDVEHGRELRRQAPRLLVQFGMGPAAARRTADLYLISLAARYLADDQTGAGARTGAVDRWLVPALTAPG